MKKLFKELEETLADAALFEMGVGIPVTGGHRSIIGRETLEENLIEVAFAEAADFEDIHRAIIREHQEAWNLAHPDDCAQGGDDLCFV
ncbi:MAG TPA: hypothetical protein VL197_10445 [Nitrospirota bacterium]|nr:hypothetical protein [Nitrospirota bacterium]